MTGDAAEFDKLRARVFYPKTDITMGVDDLHAFLASKPERLKAFVEIIPDLFNEDNVNITPLENAGTMHDVFFLSGPDGDLVLRIFAGPKPDETLSLDHHISNFLHDCGQPALTSHIYGSGDFDYQVTDRASGAPLRDWKNKPQWPALLKTAGATFARLHGIETDGCGLLSAVTAEEGILHGLHDHWADYIHLNLDAHIAYCLNKGDITDAEADHIRQLFADWKLPEFEPVLLHGDPGPHNIFTDGENITTLIDWEDALGGDPIYELAFWATFHPDADYQPFLDGYFGSDARPDNFHQDFWMYYLRVALAKTVHRHIFGYTDAPGTLRASTRIQKALERLAA